MPQIVDWNGLLSGPECCKFYNNGECKKGYKCQFLHVCVHYVDGDCKFGDRNCKRLHSFKDSHSRKVLAQHGLGHLRNEREIISVLRSDAETHLEESSSRKRRHEDNVLYNCSPNDSSPEKKMKVKVLSLRQHSSREADPSTSTSTIAKVTDEKLEICELNLRSKCQYGEKCKARHTRLPFEWQYSYSSSSSGSWGSFTPQENCRIEKSFCNCEEDSGNATSKGRSLPVSIDFRTMNGKIQEHSDCSDGKGTGSDIRLRRLSTISAILAATGHIFQTRWKWYWNDEHNKWQPYDDGKNNTSSEKIELDFQSESVAKKHKFATDFNNYTLYFVDQNQFYQQNDKHGTKRDVRRRPAQFLNADAMKQMLQELKKSYQRRPVSSSNGKSVAVSSIPIPSHWVPVGSSKDFQVVDLSDVLHQAEFSRVKTQILATIAGHTVASPPASPATFASPLASQPPFTFSPTSQPAFTFSSASQPAFTSRPTSKRAFTFSSASQPAFTFSSASQTAFTFSSASQPDFTSLSASQPAFTSALASQPAFTFSSALQPAFTSRPTSKRAFTYSSASQPAFTLSSASQPPFTFSSASPRTFTFSSASQPAFTSPLASQPAFTFSSTSPPAFTSPASQSAFTSLPASQPAFTFSSALQPASTFSLASRPAFTFSSASPPACTLPSASQPTFTFSSGLKPAFTFAPVSQPAFTFSSASQPAVTFSSASQPDFTFPTRSVSQHACTFSSASQPAVTFSSASQPDFTFPTRSASQHACTFSSASQPAVTFSFASQPAFTSTASQHACTFSSASQPAVTFSSASQPAFTFSSASQPADTFSSASQPAFTSTASQPAFTFSSALKPAFNFSSGSQPAFTFSSALKRAFTFTPASQSAFTSPPASPPAFTFSCDVLQENRQRTSSSNETVFSIPPHWTPVDPSEEFKVVDLSEAYHYDEILKVKTQFLATMPNHTVKSIKRVQNLGLWEDYERQKSKITKKNSGNQPKEQWLFHGTNKDIVDPICQQGFDWRLSGSKHGAKYGKGSYFATDSSYSHTYSARSSGTCFRMFLAKVIVGCYTLGTSETQRPPSKDSSDPLSPLYDSCVNNVNNPTIFVIFERSQAYPNYIIDYGT